MGILQNVLQMKKVQLAGILLYLGIAYELFASGRVSQFSLNVVFFACAVTIFCICTLCSKRELLSKYKSKGCMTVIGCISIYASFANFGYDLFSFAEARMHLDAKAVYYLLIGAVWYIPVILTLLCLLEYCSKKMDTLSAKDNPYSRGRVYILLFILFAAVQMVIISGFWPGGFPNDTVWTMQQVAGDAGFDDWHPVFYTLTQRALLSIIPEPGFLAIVQMLLFAWLVTEFLMIAFDRGVPLSALIVGGLVFLLLPNQALSGIGIVKDYPFTMALLWGTLLLLKLGMDPSRARKVTFLIQLFLDQFFILAYRHNGIIPAAFIAIVCLIIGLRQVKKQLLVAVPSIVAIVAFALFKGPVFTHLNVWGNTSSPYVTMLCAVGSAVNKDLPLSEEATAILEEVMPLEDWKKYYSRFEGHDQYVWGSEKGFDTSSITAQKAFRLYFEALAKYPDVVIKDRLDGMNILWCIQEPVNCFNTRYFDAVFSFDFTEKYINVDHLERHPNDWIGYVNRSAIAEFYRAHDAADRTQVWDILIWRSGIYVILLLTSMLFWFVNRMKHIWLASVPLLGNLFGSLFLVYHQSFRYVYFIQLLTVALVFMSVVTKGKDKLEEKNEY